MSKATQNVMFWDRFLGHVAPASRHYATAWGLLAASVVLTLPSAVHAQDFGWLTATVSKHHCETGMEIELEEAVRLRENTGVVGITHGVWCSGIYHRRISRFVLVSDGGWHKLASDESVVGLPMALVGPHGMALQETAKRGWFGKTFRFKFLDPGIYVINAEWDMKTRGAAARGPVLKGPPLIVFVRPAADYDAAARGGLGDQERLEQYYDEHHEDTDFRGLVLPDFGGGPNEFKAKPKRVP